MKNKNWNYNNFYEKYDMNSEIKIGTGIVKVHNIFDNLPKFMKLADCIFCDPPCSKSNINSFYTKADRKDYQESYEPFQKRFFECIDEINPQKLYIEVFKSNKEYFINECNKRYKYVNIIDSKYYNKDKNKCWIIQCQNTEIQDKLKYKNLDEQIIIEKICKEENYNCIGDLCMGKGLVGYYANKYNKKFVGTEINKKRLAVLIERINKNKLICK